MQDYQKVQHNEYQQTIGVAVANPVPIHFSAKTLSGQHATLQVLSADTLTEDRMQQIWHTVKTEADSSCWTYLPYCSFKSLEDLQKALQHHFSFNHSIHYLIEIEQRIVGWIALLNPRLTDHAIEIGNVYFSHQMKQSIASTEVIYLLLNTCFAQGFRRVEWKCDDLNQPSKRAALRFGFQYEGTFRQDRITKARNRNTAWFSMLDGEWLKVEKAYCGWLQADNFDFMGQQKIKLADLMQPYALSES